MEISKLVEEIIMDGVLQKEPKAYKDVYFIRTLNPGDRIQYFCSFRYNTPKKDCVIVRVDIDLEKPEANVMLGMSILLPFEKRMRQSITFYRKSLQVNNKTIVEILKQVAIPQLIEKLTKFEGMSNASH